MKKDGKQKKKNSGQWIGMVIFLLIGAACGMLFMTYMNHTGENGADKPGMIPSLVLMLVCLYGAMLVQIILHEAGHLVFGLMTGYGFSSFRIFNVMLVKEDEHIRIRHMSVAGTGGQCLMTPPDLKDGKIPVLLYSFGGSLMNLLVGAVCFGFSFACRPYSFPWMLLMVFAVIGLAYALMNGLPVKMGQVNNDGRNAMDVSGNETAMRAYWLQMKMNELVSKGIRLKDMPDEWFIVPGDEDMRNGIVATVGVMACNRLMDQHRFEEADDLMRRLLSQDNGIVGIYRGFLLCDRMYVEMITENRTEVIESMRTKEQLNLMKAMGSYPSIARTEYVYALLMQRDREAAETALKWFEKHAKTYPYPSEIGAERELMAIADEVYENRLGKDAGEEEDIG
ncbi:MAG: M50 family metallopeptidase [Clostridia bacterium]|nr:M50 family metallopeptidase [Clostridia bacterium]